MAAWHSNGVAHINKVALRRARLVLGRVTVSGSNPGAGHLSRYVTSHPGKLNLAIPSWVGTMSTSQKAVTPCGCGVKAGMVRVWLADDPTVTYGSYLSALEKKRL